MAEERMAIQAITDATSEPSASSGAKPRSHFFGLTFTDEEKASSRIGLAICRRAAFLAFLVYCALGAFLVIYASARLIPNRWENTYPESPYVWGALHTAETGQLYVSYTDPPYILQSYGPLYFAANAAMAWMSHANLHQNIQQFVLNARTVTFACFLLCGILVFAITRRLSAGSASAALAALMLLGHPSFFRSCVVVRPDMMFLAAMALSLFVAVWEESPRPALCFLAGALGGIAFLIKQPGIGVLLAIAIVWLLHKQFRQTILLAAGAATPVALTLVLLLLRHERHFLRQYLTVGKAYWSLPNGLLFLAGTLYSLGFIIPVAIAAIGFARAIGAGWRGQVLASFALVNWVVGLSGAPQVGSAVNYFFPALLGCALLLPFALMVLRERVRSAAVLVLIALGLCYATALEAKEGKTVLATRVNLASDPYGSFAPFHILSDRPVFAFHGLDPDLLDPLSAHIMEVAGNWSSAPIAAKMRRGDYDFVILGCSGDRVICSYRGINFFSADLIGAINDNYAVFCSNPGEIVFTPRSRQVNATTGMFTEAFGQPCDTKFRGHAPDLLTFGGTR